MTALDEYARLESIGLWRATPAVQRREVGLSFGEATLVISDAVGRPITHWSLPAIRRLNPGAQPAMFSPDPEATETLEVEDTIMSEALEKVRLGLARQRPRQGRLRLMMTLGILAGLAALTYTWLPGALTRQTLSVVPPAKRAEIGATLLGHMQRTTGPSCRDPLGTAALAALQGRVLGRDAPGQLVVMPSALAAPAYLPGGIIALPLSVIDATDDPTVVAGHVLAAALSRSGADPLERALSNAGLGATFTLLTTGDIPPAALEAYADYLVTTPSPLADASTLGPGFELAQVAISPWAYALDPTGATIDDLLAVEWVTDQPAPSILGDGHWVSLQGICQ
jgi:hypothetical protein